MSLARFFSAAAPAIGGVLGGMVGGPVGAKIGAGLGAGFSAQQKYRDDKRAATRQMQFQERMSSTSYQRGVQDMRSAGINPMVAYQQGGASTPAGAMQHPAPDYGGSGVSSAEGLARESRTVAETLPNKKLEQRLDEEIRELHHRGSREWNQAKLILEQERLTHQEVKVAIVNATIAEFTVDARKAADLEIFLREAKEAKLAGRITESRYGEWLRWIDRAIDLLRGIIGGGGLAPYANPRDRK